MLKHWPIMKKDWINPHSIEFLLMILNRQNTNVCVNLALREPILSLATTKKEYEIQIQSSIDMKSIHISNVEIMIFGFHFISLSDWTSNGTK